MAGKVEQEQVVRAFVGKKRGDRRIDLAESPVWKNLNIIKPADLFGFEQTVEVMDVGSWRIEPGQGLVPIFSVANNECKFSAHISNPVANNSGGQPVDPGIGYRDLWPGLPFFVGGFWRVAKMSLQSA